MGYAAVEALTREDIKSGLAPAVGRAAAKLKNAMKTHLLLHNAGPEGRLATRVASHPTSAQTLINSGLERAMCTGSGAALVKTSRAMSHAANSSRASVVPTLSDKFSSDPFGSPRRTKCQR